MGLFDSILNIANGWAHAESQRKYNSQEAEKARRETYALNEQAADNADARTRALYEDIYSPAAQMKAMKEAGISPAFALAGGASGGSGSGAMGGTNGGQASASGIPSSNANINSDEVLKIMEAKGKKIDNQMKELELQNMQKEFEDKWNDNGITNRIRNNEATISDAEAVLKTLELGREQYKHNKGYDTATIDREYENNYANAVILANQAEESNLDIAMRRRLNSQIEKSRIAELQKICYECELTKKQSENFAEEFKLRQQAVELKAAELRQKQEQFEKGLIHEKDLQEAKLEFEKEQNQLERDLESSQFTSKMELEERKLLIEKIRQRNQAIAGFVESGGKAVGSIADAIIPG